MMKSRTITQSVAAPAEAVYQFASDPRNLPRWAPGLCESVELVGGKWVVHCRDGSLATVTFAGRNALGVLDHTVTLSGGATVHVPMRVVPSGAGSEILFTLFQQPGMNDDRFADDAQLVTNDLMLLKRIVESAQQQQQ